MGRDKNSRMRVVKSRKKKIRRRVFIILVPIIIAFLSVLGYGAYLYTKADTVLSESYVEDDRGKSPLRDALVNPSIDTDYGG